MPGKFDGRSRLSNDKYRKNWDRIFKTNPVAKEVRTPKFKPSIVKARMFWADIRGHHGKVWDYEPGDYYMGSHKGHNKHIKK